MNNGFVPGKMRKILFLSLTILLWPLCVSQAQVSTSSPDLLPPPEVETKQNSTAVESTESDAALITMRRLMAEEKFEEAKAYAKDFPLLQTIHPDEWAIWRAKLFTAHYSTVEAGLSGENVSAMLIDQDDLWIGTWSGGLARLSVATEALTVWDPGLPSLALRTINRIRRDDENIFVVRYGALEQYKLRTNRWKTINKLPVNERLQDVVFFEDQIYLATLGRGLWVRGAGSHWTLMEKPGKFITGLEIFDGQIFIATMDQGLYIYDVGKEHWIRPPDGFLRKVNVTSIIRMDELFVGGTYGSGAFIWNPESNQVDIIDENLLGDSYVLTVLEHQKRVYFGTFGGGLRSWNPDNDTWDIFSLSEGLPSSDVASLASGLSSIWVGTLGGGIVRINAEIHDF